MRRCFVSLPYVLLLIVVCILSACAPLQKVGTIPRGTPDTGNGTPAVLPTVQVTPPQAKLAGRELMGSSYAFIHNNQLMLALNSAGPQQVTQFNFADLPNIFWQTPAFSAGDHYIAFIVNARKSGIGGGGCPGPDDNAGGLYVLDTMTKQFTSIALPAVQLHASVNAAPRSDNWKYMAWEDASHLLAWYNGDAGNAGNTPGLYRYDAVSQKLTLVFPLGTIGAQSATDVQKGLPLVTSVRYRNGQLFYQAVTHPFEQQGQIAIYRHAVNDTNARSELVMDVGTEAWCSMLPGAPYMFPGWDISPDSEQLVAQTTLGTIQSRHLTDGSIMTLFTHASATLLSHDVQLTWAPDNQTVALASKSDAKTQSGLYSASLANPGEMVQYSPAVSGQISWRSDSGVFALANAPSKPGDPTSAQDVYVFARGDTHGLMLLTNAHEFTWG